MSESTLLRSQVRCVSVTNDCAEDVFHIELEGRSGYERFEVAVSELSSVVDTKFEDVSLEEIGPSHFEHALSVLISVRVGVLAERLRLVGNQERVDLETDVFNMISKTLHD